MQFEAAIAECCDTRNRFSNRSGFSAQQRVFASSLRLPGKLLTADPCTNFQRTNDMRTAAP